MNFRLIAKLGLILVVIGFFMPVACDSNGFQIADFFMKNDNVLQGILTYLIFISAVIGVIIGALLLTGKASIGSNIDLIVIIVSIAAGLIVYFGSMKNNVKLQNGAYVIIVGWAVALVFQVLSIMKRE